MAPSDPEQTRAAFDNVTAGEFPATTTVIIEGPPWTLRFAFVAVLVSHVVTAVVAAGLRERRITKMAARRGRR